MTRTLSYEGGGTIAPSIEQTVEKDHQDGATSSIPQRKPGKPVPKSTFTPVKIEVFDHALLGFAVSGRELYQLISNTSANRDIFSDWYKDRIDRLGLQEGVDHIRTATVVVESGSGRARIEYIVSLVTAKRIANIQQANRGKGVLAYLEAYERGEVPAEAPSLKTDKESALPIEPTSPDAPAVDEAKNALTEQRSNPIDTSGSLIRDTLTRRKETALAALAKLQGDFDRVYAQDGATNTTHRLRTSIEHHRTSSIALALLEVGMVLSDCAMLVLNHTLTPLVKGDNGQVMEELTTRMKVVRLVDAYAAAKGQSHQGIWNGLYGQLAIRFGFDAWTHSQGKKDPNYLEIVEEAGQVDNLYLIAKEVLTLRANG